ncbi:MAG: hypothetical protein HY040_10155 [Planctomycetes bacterium]|nr:hypothetical protein [Planctomycetota bacterium]
MLEDSNLSAAELRKKLSDEGVDVNKFLKRFDDAFRRGLQARLKREAQQAKARAVAARGSLFGNLVGKSFDEMLALFRAATAGQYGGEAMARCRNKSAEAMTEDELRSWLEDIEKLNGGK